MELSLLNWLFAAAPIITVLVCMLGLRWGGSRAGALAYLVTIVVAWVIYGARFDVIAYAHVRAILLSIDVLFIIWMALLLFNMANEAGAIAIIGKKLPTLTADRTMQALLLGWLFTSFLQGMGGFGVPIAIVAPLMVSLGFSPIAAVVLTALGHAWSITFGSLGSSFQALISTTGLAAGELAPESALLLGVASFISGLFVAFISNGWKGVARGLPAIIVIGTLMSVTQYLLATNDLWTLGATGASLVGLLAAVLMSRLSLYQKEAPATETDLNTGKTPSLLLAMSPYGLLIVLAFSITLIPFLSDLFGSVAISLDFPELITRYGWVTAGGASKPLEVFSHPGSILLYTAVISFFLYRKVGYYQQEKPLKIILKKTGDSAIKSSLGIITMVSMAVIMSHAGMTNILARGISESVSASVYPAVSPFIGALGAFITGSNTNSNVIFAQLQQETAMLMHLSVPLILAAQTAGGAVGSILAPAKVIVGCSTVGLAGEEGAVTTRLMSLGLIFIGAIALFTLILN